MNELKQKAISLGLCQDWQKSWNDSRLVEMYLRGVTWCMERKYPSLKDMEPYKELLENNYVYNDRRVDLILTGHTYVLNKCGGCVEINDYNVSRIYVALDSMVKIYAKGHSHLIIDCYDNAVIQLDVEEDAKVTVWQYGNSIVQILSGKAKINKK
jgi:hypothetical protein